MRTLLLVALFAPACGRIGFDDLVDGSSADAPTCPRRGALPPPPTEAFGGLTLIAELDSAAFDDDPTLTADELEIYFESARSGASRLWRSVRATTALPWEPPTAVAELDSWMANTPELSRDGLRMRFASNGDVYLTTRASRTASWEAPVLAAELTTADPESAAVEFFDGNGIAFGSSRPGGNMQGDLWETVRDPASCAFTAPRVLAGLESPQAKGNPWMRDDGLVIVFPGTGTTGVSDLVVATRPDLETPFGTPIELTTLSSTNVDDDPWLDDGMTSIYFMSARTGDAALYHAQR